MSTLVLENELTEEELGDLSMDFEGAPPEKVLRWAVERFGPEVALATGFGAEGCALVSMLARVDRRARIFYLDTDLLFPETYALRDALETRYGVSFERYSAGSLTEQAALYGERLWERRPDECCRLRKVEPLREALDGLQAWITAIRRDQSPARASAGVIERDKKFGLVKINPLALWTTRDVWTYLIENDVPYNPLHDLGYTSIGCGPCTTPVKIGEDPRAGRWRGSMKTECGLHQ